MTPQQNITVFYDGDCPVCQMEVRWYEKLQRDGSIVWTDILSLSDSQLPDGKTRDELLGKFHVREADGSWHIGVDAFARIWRNLPYLRHGAFVFRLPGIRQMAGVAYLGFLRWQRWDRKRRHAKRDAQAAEPDPTK